MAQKSTTRLILEPLAIAVGLAVVVRALFGIYSIPSASMAPTLEVGDHILVTAFERHPQRGDVVVFRSPASPDELMVKRVIGTPGDLIATSGGHVRIGQHALAEPYLRDASASGVILPQIVPADCYFVMGDNRADSFDSRNWGVLPRALIVGRARLVLWSSGDGTSSANAHASTRRDDSASAAPSRARVTRLFRAIE
jgi:signal peptidase I